jgi:phosphoribosyl-dephospho-CoA transferase
MTKERKSLDEMLTPKEKKSFRKAIAIAIISAASIATTVLSVGAVQRYMESKRLTGYDNQHNQAIALISENEYTEAAKIMEKLLIDAEADNEVSKERIK